MGYEGTGSRTYFSGQGVTAEYSTKTLRIFSMNIENINQIFLTATFSTK
jgi:hypothetical protein